MSKKNVGGEMNIANIFGLHIGCRIKHSFVCDNRLHEGISLLTGVEILQGGTILLEAGFKEYNYQFCKLILKPLSKITDEDKAEFHKTFASNKQSIKHIGIEEGGVVFATFIDSMGNPNYVDLGIIPTLWLASKGYDIGIVPDEYKEVEE